VANLGATVYSKFAQGSPEARATEIMRQYIPGFDMYELEDESTVIFKDAYHAYLNEKLSLLELMTSEQGYEYFSAHVKMLKIKVNRCIHRNGNQNIQRWSSIIHLR